MRKAFSVFLSGKGDKYRFFSVSRLLSISANWERISDHSVNILESAEDPLYVERFRACSQKYVISGK